MAHSNSKASRGWKYRVAGRGSTALDAIEAAWSSLREIDRRIPVAVISLVDPRSRNRMHGYFANSRWTKRAGKAHEIGVSPELIGHPAELLATLLHEAAHAVLFEAGANGGMGSTDYYHTKLFRDECHVLGLRCEFRNCRYGWTLTSWPEAGVPERYRRIVRGLRRDLPAGIKSPVPRRPQGGSLPPTGHTMLVCACEGSGRTVYVKKSVRDAGGITCVFCKQAFLPETEVRPNRE